MARRIILGALAFLAITGATWHLFGWRSEHYGEFGTVTLRRSWGRYTVASVDFDGDGESNLEVEWSWRVPYEGNVDGDCGDPTWLRQREDRNLDGIWDTWQVRLYPEEPCVVLLRADMDCDGEADSEELTPLHDNAANARLKAARGF